MSSKCAYCGQTVSFPCETLCEQLHCADKNVMDQLHGKPFSAPPDPITHPPHYARWEMEPVAFIAINNLPWWLANVIKYTMRFDAKDGLNDLYKARAYLDMKIRDLEGIAKYWVKP